MTQRGYALLALMMAGMTAYLSFVPFDFEARSLSGAIESFGWVLRTRTYIESRSDFLANAIYTVPFGFFLLGSVCGDRRTFWRSSVIALSLWPLCVIYPTLIEFGQLFFHGRTSSATDIAAQAFGSACGMLLWLIVGRSLTHAIHHIAFVTRLNTTVGQLLVVYLILCFWLEMWPMDVSVSPGLAYRRLFNDVTYIPFGEGWTPFVWLLSLVLYLPVGVLLARLPTQRLLIGIVLSVPVIAEMGQVLVSRHPSVTDLLFSIAGIVGGYWLTKQFCRC